MSILIKGMEMPRSCLECPMLSYWVCRPKNEEIPDDTDLTEHPRPDWCPLVPLPEKHGRLVDADALFETMGQDTDKWLIDDISYIETDEAMSAVFKAPTIIEAEGGGGDG